MILKNLNTSESLILSDDLYPIDEFAEAPYEEREERSVTGVLLIFQQLKIGGDTLTLSTSDRHNWIERYKVVKLYEWLRQMGLKMELSFKMPEGEKKYIVSFKSSSPPAIDCKPILDSKPNDRDAFYKGIIKLRIHNEVAT